jgi:hypothetical protein
MKTIYSILFLMVIIQLSNAQTIELLAKELPPHFSILTSWGLRPEWDETSENIYFLNRLYID